MDEATTEIKEVFLKASKIQLSPSLGMAVLATSCVEKNKLITKAAEHFVILKERLQKPPVINNL